MDFTGKEKKMNCSRDGALRAVPAQMSVRRNEKGVTTLGVTVALIVLFGLGLAVGWWFFHVKNPDGPSPDQTVMDPNPSPGPTPGLTGDARTILATIKSGGLATIEPQNGFKALKIACLNAQVYPHENKWQLRGGFGKTAAAHSVVGSDKLGPTELDEGRIVATMELGPGKPGYEFLPYGQSCIVVWHSGSDYSVGYLALILPYGNDDTGESQPRIVPVKYCSKTTPGIPQITGPGTRWHGKPLIWGQCVPSSSGGMSPQVGGSDAFCFSCGDWCQI